MELDFEHKKIRLANRKNCIKPKNAKRSDVKQIRKVASKFADEIIAVWERPQP